MIILKIKESKIFDPKSNTEYSSKPPKCEAILSKITRDFWRGRGRPGNMGGFDICQCSAKYRIDGKNLCRKHASKYFFDMVDSICNQGSDFVIKVK